MRVDVKEARRDNHPFDREDVGVGRNDEARCHVHRIGIAGFADTDDQPILDPDVTLDDAENRIDDDGIGHNEIEGAVARLPFRRLAHAIADCLAAAEYKFVAVCCVVVFDLGYQAGVSEVNPVAGGGAILRRIVLAADFHAHVTGLPSSLRISIQRISCPGHPWSDIFHLRSRSRSPAVSAWTVP